MEIFGDIELYILLILIFVSFAAGFIDSVAGGGGLLMVPSLLLAGIPAQFALGTNKFVAIFGTSTALINFIRNGKVIWRIAIIGLIFSLIGSVFGTKAILLFDEKTVTTIILWILPFTAIVTFIPRKHLKSQLVDFSKRELYLFVPLICLVLGFYDGFFGPGMGTFLIIAFYVVLGMNTVNASAVAKAVNLASGVGAFITFAFAGKVLYMVGLPLAIANIAGGFAGSKMAIVKGHSFIRVTIVVVFIVMFISLIVKYFN